MAAKVGGVGGHLAGVALASSGLVGHLSPLLFTEAWENMQRRLS